ncbi:TPA: efflux RND transporter periplasmic adaptor subunit [Yersinia enterocolitica]|jgi:RND family efflux transporter MFP subunit|uniref:Efflux RND transporter periplasmic adaptor subunit n=1 Tax=Escherichia coli TaxID=562 RepID=A0A3L0VZJ0_ECOLX|nr:MULTISPECIES: efflux RND transporter periplasmic adaptor subunit [Gammaproteobacteria]HDL6709541.1 efflux RND transporter periplasmic adaptor subunit [Yersinia enterocolitica]AUV17915.1 efflux RND transporter periplasmic adaptor subunit [Aeromonas sp. ASNIH7]MCB5315845.1 efflux RND transporter periplasmic adaptor subunit [Yersinia intermedia]MCU8019084.1 efflux RND transporter periplasmic adaptor subunit [Shewanella sp. SM72]MDB1113979.1 efflux RND transporter periplasmic adaptor subunit [P
MKKLPLQGRTLALLAVIIPLLVLFIYVGLRSGPLAPVAVTVASVESRAITPALFGIGTVEARYTYKIGPTFAGRVKRLEVHVGDQVKAGQVLGEMEPVDLDDRVRSQESAFKRAEAALREAEARQAYAQTQARRYEQLFAVRSTSEEIVTTKRQELQIADAALSAAREDIVRARSDREGLVAQRSNLRLIAPVDGVVAVRDADPGTTIVAGQAVVEVIDPKSLWINVRFDQISASGLAGGLPTRIVLRSRSGQTLKGRVLRVEPKADAVTEEMIAKVTFDSQPETLPPVGELAEVTVDLPALQAAPLIPNAAVQRMGDKIGVWQVVDGDLRFSPVKLGASDLNGYVQVREGLKNRDQVVTYSEKALTPRSRIHVVDHIPGVSR